MLQIKF